MSRIAQDPAVQTTHGAPSVTKTTFNARPLIADGIPPIPRSLNPTLPGRIGRLYRIDAFCQPSEEPSVSGKPFYALGPDSQDLYCIRETTVYALVRALDVGDVTILMLFGHCLARRQHGAVEVSPYDTWNWRYYSPDDHVLIWDALFNYVNHVRAGMGGAL